MRRAAVEVVEQWSMEGSLWSSNASVALRLSEPNGSSQSATRCTAALVADQRTLGRYGVAAIRRPCLSCLCPLSHTGRFSTTPLHTPHVRAVKTQPHGSRISRPRAATPLCDLSSGQPRNGGLAGWQRRHACTLGHSLKGDSRCSTQLVFAAARFQSRALLTVRSRSPFIAHH